MNPRSLDHHRIITFINAWINKQKDEVVFITERVWLRAFLDVGDFWTEFEFEIKSHRLNLQCFFMFFRANSILPSV